MLSIIIVSFILITWRRLEKHKHKHHIVFTFHQLSFMLVIQLSYSESGMPVKRYYYFSYESFLNFLRESALWLESVLWWEYSALRDVHIVQFGYE